MATFPAIALYYTVFVILFGAVVRITGSGAGCGQHWPTCHGEIAHLPRSVETAIELTHRVTSGLALVGVVALALLTIRKFPVGHLARRFAYASVALMVVEALIGAGLVLLSLVGKDSSVARTIVVPAHLLSTYALTAVLTLTARFSSAHPPGPLRRVARYARLLAFGAALAVMVVSAMGAVTALGDTLYPPSAHGLGARLVEDQGGGVHFLKRLRVLHPVLAVLAAGFLFSALPRLGALASSRLGRGAARFAVATLVTQLAAGVLNVLLSAPGWLQVAHLGLALGLWVALVLLVTEALTGTAPEAAERAPLLSGA